MRTTTTSINRLKDEVKSPKQLFKERYGSHKDKWDRVAKKFDYYDMIDFAEYLGEYYGFYTKAP